LGSKDIEGGKIKKLIYLFVMAVFIGGCASNSGVVPIGKDTYMVSRQAATGFSGSGPLKAKAFQEASQYCESQGKELRAVSTSEIHPLYIFANFPRVKIKFMCLDANDPRLIRQDNEEVYMQLEKGLMTKMEALDKLFSDGCITKKEFEKRKQKLLDDYKSKKN
jgi:hypothetical protein